MKPNLLVKISLLIGSVNFFGVVGYMTIEKWDFIDALYMTAITLSTVGFGEVIPLSPEGRIFTVSLIFIGLTTFAYGSRAFIQELATNLQGRGKKIMEKKMQDLEDHTIVLGFGRMGKSICEELYRHGKDFVVIEKHERSVESLRKTKYLWIIGDASDDENLRKANVEKAKNLVSVVDSDADGLFAAVAARSFNPEIHIVVRASSESAKKKMLLAGVDEVVLPFIMSGVKVAQKIVNPDIEELLELSGVDDAHNKLQIIDIHVKENSPLAGKSLKNCGLRRDGFIVVGIRLKNSQFVFAPRADLQFSIGDTLVALGTKSSLSEAKEVVNRTAS